MGFIELYRSMVPRTKILNDNTASTYRANIGKDDWLGYQFDEIKDGFQTGPGDFNIPSLKEVQEILGTDMVSIRCEVWRPLNRRFDPQNYARTFKKPLDLLVTNGYIKDDDWGTIESIAYSGGGGVVWKKAYRYEDDNLPDELSTDWWSQYTDDYYEIMIRILAKAHKEE